MVKRKWLGPQAGYQTSEKSESAWMPIIKGKKSKKKNELGSTWHILISLYKLGLHKKPEL